MSAGILLVTHEDIGAQLVAVCDAIFKQRMAVVAVVSVPANLRPEALGEYADLIRNAMLARDNGEACSCSPMYTGRRPITWPGILVPNAMHE